MKGRRRLGWPRRLAGQGGLTGTPGPSLVCWFEDLNSVFTVGSSEPRVPSLGAAACPDLTSMVLAMSKAGRELAEAGCLATWL